MGTLYKHDQIMGQRGYDKVESVRVELGFEGLLAVDSVGLSGCVVLVWKEKGMCTVLGYRTNFIDVKVEIVGLPCYRFTGFYGLPGSHQRRQSWNIMQTLKNTSSLPWCIGGDFNDILSFGDKMGRIQQPVWRVDGFRQIVEECELRDLGFTGNRFAWESHRNTRNLFCERLDRVLTTSQWVFLFPKAQVHHVEAANSDHSTLFLTLGVSVIRYAF
ncbi:uncharacterized protein LOC142182616 [Nicotiana tabacum]|uniref:Uncharacterized protein LOC142182616 n=1 Tax=Nicotiana tabacum TaxID=4097 RepID=A0AC58UTV3_TOBAC